MKLVFICGFLEPGSCGVGDYTRRIAAELIRQKHEVAIVAVNDKFLEDEFEGYQSSDGINIPVLRIPASTASTKRFSKAKKWIDAFDPEWLSLQFVLFSFQPKGLPFALSHQLAELGKGRKWHLMFHELWLGLEKEAKLKIVVWGLVQKILIKGLIRSLKPQVVHTQTRLHISELLTINVNAHFLPLISNIPVASWKSRGNVENSKKISIVIFGSIYYGAPIELFAKETASWAKKRGFEVTITSIGKNRHGSDKWIAYFKNEGLKVEILGEQAPEKISEVLDNATFGITTTPFLLIQKSGTVISMREHGLPVICISREFTPRGEFAKQTLPGVMEYVPGNLESCFASRGKQAASNSVRSVANQLIESLNGETGQKRLFSNI
jgi:hypothetical protein